MDPTVTQWWFKAGDRVISADDHQLGKVVAFVPDAATPTHLVLAKGIFVKHEHRIPVDAVEQYLDDTIYLGLTKDEALRLGGASTAPVEADSTATEEPW